MSIMPAYKCLISTLSITQGHSNVAVISTIMPYIFSEFFTHSSGFLWVSKRILGELHRENYSFFYKVIEMPLRLLGLFHSLAVARLLLVWNVVLL